MKARVYFRQVGLFRVGFCFTAARTRNPTTRSGFRVQGITRVQRDKTEHVCACQSRGDCLKKYADPVASPYSVLVFLPGSPTTAGTHNLKPSTPQNLAAELWPAIPGTLKIKFRTTLSSGLDTMSNKPLRPQSQHSGSW